MTPNEQQEVLNRIKRQFEELVLELDQPELQIIQQDLIQNQIPLPEHQDNEDFFLPRQYAIREDEVRLISEDEIQQPRQLPPPRQ